MRHPARSGARALIELLFQGQRTDWRYSLVTLLVITGLFSTPLVLGSIRNRVYRAVKTQIEVDNNAREIVLELQRETAPPLSSARVLELRQAYPAAAVVGNFELVVSAEGPQGSELLTLQTLEPADPRSAFLRITPAISSAFGLTDVVISDQLGQQIYLVADPHLAQDERHQDLADRWDALWRDGEFLGPPLRLRINDVLLTRELRPVARRRLPGKGLYGSHALGEALRRYSRGLGAPELGLDAVAELEQASLPRAVATRCVLWTSTPGALCDGARREALGRRLAALQFPASLGVPPGWPALPELSPWTVELTEVTQQQEGPSTRPRFADCVEVLAPVLAATCPGALVSPDLGVAVTAHTPAGPLPTRLQAAGAEVLGLFAANTGTGFALLAPRGSGFEAGQAVEIEVTGSRLAAHIAGLYPYSSGNCPLLAEVLPTFRLVNLTEGVVELASREPLTFTPAQREEDFDQILLYPPTIEDVEPTTKELRASLPGYIVDSNETAIERLNRQDGRLRTLFGLTMALSALFLVLALGALARINLERRRRQMAQLLILGFPRTFVRRLVVAEALALALISGFAAVVTTGALCWLGRVVLGGRGLTAAADRGDFDLIVRAMNVDPVAFTGVFVVVLACTWVIASFTARRAAQADPLTLLD